MLNELCRIDAQSTGDPNDAGEGRVHLASLDVADVGPVQAGELPEAFLGHTEFSAVAADAVTKGGLERVDHPGTVTTCIL